MAIRPCLNYLVQGFNFLKDGIGISSIFGSRSEPSVRLEYDQIKQMKILYLANVNTPSNLKTLQRLAFEKSWEFVESYYTSHNLDMPEKHGDASYTIIKNGDDDVSSDAALRSCLQKGIRTFQVYFKDHPHSKFRE